MDEELHNLIIIACIVMNKQLQLRTSCEKVVYAHADSPDRTNTSKDKSNNFLYHLLSPLFSVLGHGSGLYHQYKGEGQGKSSGWSGSWQGAVQVGGEEG